MSFSASASLGASANRSRVAPMASHVSSSIVSGQRIQRSGSRFVAPLNAASASTLPTTTLLDRRRQRRQRQNSNLIQRQRRLVRTNVNPFDLAWGTSLPSAAANVDPQQLAANLFAFSIVPYSGFLFHLHRSRATPKLTLFGFYFLLVFVFATIPAGIYAKTHYGKILADVDWLHGSAESLLTLTNLFVVIGLRQALREAEGEAKKEKKEREEEEAAAASESLASSSTSSPVEK